MEGTHTLPKRFETRVIDERQRWVKLHPLALPLVEVGEETRIRV